jgi:hypothetical protein
MLNRKKPLRRSRLARGGGPARTRMKRRRWQPAVPVDTSAGLTVRSGGVCEIALPGCAGRATDPSHRITTKVGGRHGQAKLEHDQLSDLMHACRPCHDWIGANPGAAEAAGLVLREGDDPATSPVLYRGRRALLGDDGLVDYLHERPAA